MVVRNIILQTVFLILAVSCELTMESSDPGCFDKDVNDNNAYALQREWIFLGFVNDRTGEEACKPSGIGDMDIKFSDTTTFTAKSSCNLFDGTYTTTPTGGLNIKNLATTLKFCDEKSVKNWESDYFEALKNATEYRVRNDILTIETSGDRDIVFRVE